MMPDKRTVDKPMGMLDSFEDERSVVVKGEMYDLLEPLTLEMRSASTVAQVVSVALELILKAQGKEIALLENGRVVGRYNLWK